jgi:hypothetical protein
MRAFAIRITLIVCVALCSTLTPWNDTYAQTASAQPRSESVKSQNVLPTSQQSDAIKEGGTPTFIFYNWIKCIANTVGCGGTKTISIYSQFGPDKKMDWQICSLYSTDNQGIQSKGINYVTLTPLRWRVSGDPLDQPGFMTYRLEFNVPGNQQVEMYNVGLRLISGNATLDKRISAGCDVPDGPAVLK